MSTYLTQVKGFTPVIDAIVQDLGLMPALVFGNVWRYCQGESGVCTASLDTIADRIGISRKTVERHVKALCEAGYLKDTTPDLKHKPHTYADTRKALITGQLAAEKREQGKTESLTSSPSGETESLTRSDIESDQGKTESLTKRVLQDTTQENNPNGADKPPPPTSLTEWLKLIEDSNNRPAALRFMIKTLYPYLKECDLPNYGYIGKIAIKLGGAGLLTKRLWEACLHQPRGDILAYVQKMNGGNGNANRNPKRSTILAANSPAARDYNTPTPEQIAEAKAALKARDRKLQSRPEPAG